VTLTLKEAAVVRVELEGHAPWERKLEGTAEGADVEATLEPLPARIEIRGAAPGARLHLFLDPDPRLLPLWSDNPEAIEGALRGLDASSAARVRDRLVALAGRPEPGIRARASALAAVVAAPLQLFPAKSVAVDGVGKGAFEGLGSGVSHRVLATASGWKDWVSGELRTVPGGEEIARAEMPALPPPPAPEPVAAPPPPPPKPEPKPAPPPPPKPEPKPVPAWLGEVKFVHPEYGVFVALEAGAGVAAGGALETVKDGTTSGRLGIEKVTAPEPRYPHGCAVCRVLEGAPAPGDKVRGGKK
jgi:hypothetical protein